MVVGDISTGTELLVIGAGPGGYVAAIRAGQLDLDVTLVDKDHWGGVCLNHGCIPSKALISATNLAEEAGAAEELGVHADPAIDISQTMAWKDGVVERMTGGVEKLCKANGVTLMEGRAEFADANSARVVHGGEGQGAETIEFERAVVATGSRPIEIPGFDFADEPVLDSRAALSLDSVPERLVVVGAGYIGMELATVYAKAGADVTVVEMLDGVLPGFERDLARPVRKRGEELGIEFHFGRTASEWYEHDGGVRVVTEPAEAAAEADGGAAEADGAATAAEDEGPLEFDASKVLVAVGRRPVTDTVDLEAAGIEVDDRGFVPTDDRGRTNVEHVFAIGDVAGEPMLAHKASAEGRIVAEVAAGEPAAMDYQAVPAVVFTDPEVATVGMTEAEAAEAGFEPVAGKFPFRAGGRAPTTGHTEGFVRVVADGPTGFVLGGAIVGHEAAELVSELALAIEMGATLQDLAATIHPHPTLSEATMEAAEHALGHAIHTLNR